VTSHTTWRTVVACGSLLVTLGVSPAAQQAAPPPKAPASQKPAAERPARAQGSSAFDALVKKAEAARDANRLEEALDLYGRAVKMRPSYAEGYWYIGTTHYDLDRHREARDAFRRVVDLQPENGGAWVFKGICEFRLNNLDTALTDLARARELGFGNNKELAAAATYHSAILLTRNGHFEQALQMLRDFAQDGGDSPRVIEAMGMALLRMPMLPSELPGTQREMVMLAGRASYFAASRLSAAAQKAFEQLVLRYPETPHVHYAYGLFLTTEQPDRSIELFQAELKVSPRHPWAKMQIAAEYIRRGDYEAARPWAEQAVQEGPHLFGAHRVLGTVKLETGDVAGAITEFEEGVKLAPDNPTMHFSLARAYRRAGRTADADRAQAEFARLDREARTRRTGAQSVGGADDSSEPLADPKPESPQ
jgi:tetratricopeptide (TPR) repeat protein